MALRSLVLLLCLQSCLALKLQEAQLPFGAGTKTVECTGDGRPPSNWTGSKYSISGSIAGLGEIGGDATIKSWDPTALTAELEIHITSPTVATSVPSVSWSADSLTSKTAKVTVLGIDASGTVKYCSSDDSVLFSISVLGMTLDLHLTKGGASIGVVPSSNTSPAAPSPTSPSKTPSTNSPPLVPSSSSSISSSSMILLLLFWGGRMSFAEQ
mmetsp:Transcript_44215/g.94190  ORF Transcript_44215/g.94190 Transcript_44215/m.94190 type:complete len:212 (-) Transcript_44215:177-812(-)